MKNISHVTEPLCKTYVVYEFICISASKKRNISCIFYAATTLSRRLGCHLSEQSAMTEHVNEHTNYNNSRQLLLNNTRILYKSNCLKRLNIMEDVYN